VLTTSRAQLRLRGEHNLPVQPLAVPEPSQPVTLDAAADWPAVGLFVERARAVQPAFRLTPDNVAAVLGICQRLDGLPLALELAAARIAVLSPSALLVRLEQRLPLLSSGARVMGARRCATRSRGRPDKRSEQRLFRRLSAFAGGWTLALADEVAGDSATPPSVDDLFAWSSTSRRGTRRWRRTARRSAGNPARTCAGALKPARP
jgi:non-specific serine/threonine protein kinase